MKDNRKSRKAILLSVKRIARREFGDIKSPEVKAIIKYHYEGNVDILRHKRNETKIFIKGLRSLYGKSRKTGKIKRIHQNVFAVCAECGDGRQLEWQKQNTDTVIKPGDLIKKKFDHPTLPSEWMWVEITSVDGDKMVGNLGNDPHRLPLVYGQPVEVLRSEIAQHQPQ